MMLVTPLLCCWLCHWQCIGYAIGYSLDYKRCYFFCFRPQSLRIALFLCKIYIIVLVKGVTIYRLGSWKVVLSLKYFKYEVPCPPWTPSHRVGFVPLNLCGRRAVHCRIRSLASSIIPHCVCPFLIISMFISAQSNPFSSSPSKLPKQ